MEELELERFADFMAAMIEKYGADICLDNTLPEENEVNASIIEQE